ncbi:MAG: carbohydrate kinase family protein [Blautia sp.]|nr:carbohydrate kinase family protein [Blautia sp.]MDD7729954.1 carbohydrate kinase family protein [Clostridia bacterium]MDY5665361.1 carbohydrate kinase family protein [Blautia sp.]
MNDINVICIGSAVMDITAYPVGQKNSWQEKQRISSIRIRIGGDAANQSVHLADLGIDTALAACVGDDENGRILRNTLKERGVNTAFIKVKNDWETGTALVLTDEAGERHIFSVQGAHSTISKDDLPEIPEFCKAISLASLFSMPQLERDGLLVYLKEAKKKGIPVFADLASDKQKQGLTGIQKFLPYIDYFLPSLYDALAMTGAADAQEAAEKYRSLGVKCVVIKCGKDGCYYAAGKQCGHIPAPSVHPADTTGAGDCMSALFISRILKGYSVEAACRFACAGATYSTLFPGAAEEKLTENRISEFYSQTKKGADIYE